MWAWPAQVFSAKGLRHPSVQSMSFVPNDVQMGGGSPAFVVLTGPNMGGAQLCRPFAAHQRHAQTLFE